MSYNNNNNNQVSDSMERGVVVRDGSGAGLRGRFDNGGPIRNSPFKNGPPGTGGSGNKVAPLNEIVEQIMPLEGNQFEVFWQNLSYVVERFQISDLIKKRDEGRIKTIIRNMNGRFRSGEICAIMGPSGAGKSTLLECVAGKRRKGMSGEVFIRGGINIKVSFIAQKDQLLPQLTIKESLLYASKLKNHGIDADMLKLHHIEGVHLTVKNFHETIINQLMDQLGLAVCQDVRVIMCSGGQQKRLSIALELISRPNIVILDEPTSGLDAASCYVTIKTLRDLTQYNQVRHPVAIAATIHQPSAKVFNLFHHIYVISRDGQCIYQGPPGTLINVLEGVSLYCPKFHNPADYISEIASGEAGQEAINNLALQEKRFRNWEKVRDIMQKKRFTISLSAVSNNHKFPFWTHLWHLMHRSFIVIWRDPQLTLLRFLAHLFIGLFIGHIYGTEIGELDGCVPQTDLSDLNSLFNMRKKLEEDTRTLMENASCVFFAVLFMMFGSMMPTTLTFPLEAAVFRKERLNSWYSVGTYFMAKTFADIPFQILFPAIFITITYWMTGQIREWYRFFMFYINNVVLALVGQSQGMLISAIFVDEPSAAVFIAPTISVPIMLFAGFFIRISKVPWYLRPIGYLSYMKYSFEASMTAIYGFGRCARQVSTGPQETPEWLRFLEMMAPEEDGSGAGEGESGIKQFINEINGALNNTDPSLVMRQFELTDGVFLENMAKLLASFFIMRLLAYLILSKVITRQER